MPVSKLSSGRSTPAELDHRWLVLVVVSIAQLMVPRIIAPAHYPIRPPVAAPQANLAFGDVGTS